MKEKTSVAKNFGAVLAIGLIVALFFVITSRSKMVKYKHKEDSVQNHQATQDQVQSVTQVGMYPGPHTVITTIGTEWFAPVLTGRTRIGNIHPLTSVTWQRRINGDDSQVRDMGPGVEEEITNTVFSLEWRIKPGQKITSCKFAHDEIPIRN